MAGHSKWSQIKRKKAAEDSKRGKLFGRLIREITVAAREGGGDPDGNPWLRTAIDNAKPPTCQRTTSRRRPARDRRVPGASYEEVTYEAYGPAALRY